MADHLSDILIVDDDTTIVDTLVAALQEAGANISVAYDGASALLAIQLYRPSLVLLDLHMPGVNGKDVMAELWWSGLTDVPVVMMTADAEAVQKRITSGYDEYILKPFTLDTILSCVARYVHLANYPSGA